VVNTQQAEKVAFFIRPGGDVDFRAQPFGQLDGGQADPARRAVDEHLFVGLQPGQMVQGVIDRKEGAGNGHRRLEGDPGREVGDGIGLGDHPVAEAGRAEAHHLVAGCEWTGRVADVSHDSGKFEPQGRAGETVFNGFFGGPAQGVHNEQEIGAGGQAFDPGGFSAATGGPGGERSWMELLFMSFTTLSSTGLGDVVPVKPFARGLVMIEQLAGVAYVAIVVSRLVGLTVYRRAETEKSPPSAGSSSS